MLTVRFKISRLELGLLVLCHLAALAGIFYTAVPFWLYIAGFVIVASSLVWQLLSACHRTKTSLLRLDIGQQSSRLYYPGHSCERSLPEAVYISEWLLVLRFWARVCQPTRTLWFARFRPATCIRVVIFADSLPEEILRQMRVYLRFGFIPALEARHHNVDGSKTLP